MTKDEVLMMAEVLSREKELEKGAVFLAIEAALATATRKIHREDIEVRVSIDQGTGDYEESSGSVNFLLITILVAILALLLILIMSMIKQPELLPSKHMEKSKENLSGDEILEAELLDVVDDFEKNT